MSNLETGKTFKVHNLNENPAELDGIVNQTALSYQSDKLRSNPNIKPPEEIDLPVDLRAQFVATHSRAQNEAFHIFEFLRNAIKIDLDVKVLVPGIIRVRKKFPLEGEEAEASFLLVEGSVTEAERTLIHVGGIRSFFEAGWANSVTKEPITEVNPFDTYHKDKLSRLNFPFVEKEDVELGEMRHANIVLDVGDRDTDFYKRITQLAFKGSTLLDRYFKPEEGLPPALL